MEEQEIPQGSGKVYHFIPAERNDTVRNTGRHKYLPINICGNEGENCKQVQKLMRNPQKGEEERCSQT